MALHHRNETALRQEIVRVGQLMYDKSLVIGRDGNISARLDDHHILITPSGLCKGMMTEDQLIIIDMAGNRVDQPTEANRHLRPTSEITMHLEAYKQRADIGGVVHAHPPHAIALSIADISLAECMLPEAILFLGIIQTTPYATPSSPENADAIRNVIGNHDGILLQRHGSLTVGNDPLDAFFKTETLEQISRITYMMRNLGAGDPLPPYQVEKLMAIRQSLGLAHPGEEAEFCEVCGVCHPQLDTAPETNQIQSASLPEDELVHLIAEQVINSLAELET
ncbi:MAG: class II aldolase/adducin family protein [Chloroflexota bacterium]